MRLVKVDIEFIKPPLRSRVLGGNIMRWDGDANPLLAFPDRPDCAERQNQAMIRCRGNQSGRAVYSSICRVIDLQCSLIKFFQNAAKIVWHVFDFRRLGDIP